MEDGLGGDVCFGDSIDGAKRRALRKIEMKGDMMPQSSRSSPKTKPKVIAAIPCFNTEPFIADVVSKAKRYVDQVVVIDDGSHDGTAEVARAAGALVVSYQKNLGKGVAMKTAVENTDADIIVFLDGDGQHDPEDIPKLLTPIVQGKAVLVIGSRCLPESKVSVPPFTRRLSNNLASFAISVIISFLLPLAAQLNRLAHLFKPTELAQGTQSTPQTAPTIDYRLMTGRLKWITDCTSGFRAIKKDRWRKLDLTSQGFQIETEMIYEAARNKFTIAEVPISCSWNGKLSQLSILRDGLKTLNLLGKKLLNDARGRQDKNAWT
jgi:glycosyltransferase involved in cell wall biosynthesis